MAVDTRAQDTEHEVETFVAAVDGVQGVRDVEKRSRHGYFSDGLCRHIRTGERINGRRRQHKGRQAHQADKKSICYVIKLYILIIFFFFNLFQYYVQQIKHRYYILYDIYIFFLKY